MSELLDVDHSHGLVVEMARTVLDKKPELEQAKAIEMVHRHLFGEGGLAPEAATAWLALASSDSDDWNVRRGADKLAETFASDDPQPFLDAIDAKVAQDGGSAKLTLARASLLRAADRHEEAAVVLETALKDESDNLELWQALRSVQLKLGRSIAAAETLETIAELEKNEAQQKRHWKSLVRTWTSLQAPERALAASEKLGDDAGTDSGIPGFPAGFVIPMGAVYVINGVTYVGGDEDKKKGLPKSFADVREALDDPELDEGLVMRRLWRQFPVGQPRPRVSYGPYRYRNLTLANLTWPADEVEEEESADDADDKKGGFLGYDPLEPEPKPEPPNAYDRMNVSDALVAEQERFLRTVSANELDRLQRLLEGLLKVEAARTSDEAVLERLLAKADAGDAGRADQIRLLALLDQNPERVTGAAAEALSQLVRTIPPRDASQVRRLARVLLQSGAKEEALRLYRWCALQSSELAGYGNEDSLDVVTYVSNRDLVKEARDHLEGDAQLALIETVLETSRPVDSPWQRESYETLVLDTWDDVVAAADARERAREVIDAALDLSTGLRRSVALRAASILVRAGDHAEGLRALEIGVAKLDSSLVAQPEERWYRSDPERVGYLGIEARRRLFPPLGGDIPDAASWFAQAADSIEAWRREERWDESAAVDVLALLAIRLDEVGEGERARALASRLRGAADLAPNSALWVVDALRQLGYPEEAMARERALLAEGRLNVERMAATVAAIRELEGGEAALAAASSVSDVVRHPALMDELVLAAIAANDEEEAQRWRDAKAAAEMARAALEESDKK